MPLPRVIRERPRGVEDVPKVPAVYVHAPVLIHVGARGHEMRDRIEAAELEEAAPADLPTACRNCERIVELLAEATVRGDA